jgi:hypothetical protein
MLTKTIKMSKNFVIKAQPGVTYECYIGFTDHMGSRVRRGQRYYMMSEWRDFYYMHSTNRRGYGKAVSKKKFASHFVPVNPIECCDE